MSAPRKPVRLSVVASPHPTTAVDSPARTGDPPLRVGVSACLLGSEVRFDGQHKRDAFLVDDLGPFVEWVPFCPEVDVGMGVPRESVRLVRGADPDDAGPRMLGVRSGHDWTARMNKVVEARVRALVDADIDGYVLKSNSPSCGMERVKLYASHADDARVERHGVGLFAAALARHLPHLPVEEEGRLCDARLRENFIERLFAHQRLRALFASRWTIGALVAFHTRHKMTLLAHAPVRYRELGRLVATAKTLPRAELRARYTDLFMSAMTQLATPGKHADVLSHMLGHLRGKIDARDRAELVAIIDDHRRGLVPLIVPITLLRHHLERYAVAYLAAQTYLVPHPKELMLRNRV